MKPKLLILFLLSSFIQTIAQNNSISLVNHWADGPCLSSYEDQGLLYIGNGGHLDVLEIDSIGNPVLIGSVVTFSVVKDIFVLDSLAYIAGYNLGLQIINVSYPAEPEIIGSIDTPGTVLSVFVLGNRAYLGEDHGIRVVDISNPWFPQLEGYYSFGSYPNHYASDLWVVGDIAYVANSNGGLKVLDISESNDINEIGSFDALHSRGLFVEGEYLYLVSLLGGFYIIDISDPGNPIEVSASPSGYGAYSLVKRGGFLYTSGMSVWDIGDLSSPIEVGNFFGSTYDNVDISMLGNFVCLSSKSNGLRTIDVSNPYTIHSIGNISTSGSARDVVVIDDYAYIADGSEGLQIIDVSEPAEPLHIAQYYSNGYASYIRGDGDFVYLSDYDVFRIIDVSDPYIPNEIGVYSPNNIVNKFDISNSKAFICSGWGLRILDIANPSIPTEIGTYWTEFMQYPTTVSLSGEIACIFVYDELGIVDNGLHFVDVSDASEPELIGFLPIDGNVMDLIYKNNLVYMVNDSGKFIVHDASDISQPVEISSMQFDYPMTSIKVIDQRAYLVPAETGGDLIIVDVSDPYSLIEIGNYNKINHFSKNVFISDTLAYMASTWSGMHILDVSMQGELTLTGSYETRGASKEFDISNNVLYLANGGGGMGVFDVDSSGVFEEVGFFEFDGDANGVVVSGNHAFIADKQNGLRIVDVQDINNMAQVGFCDVYVRKIDTQGDFVYTVGSSGLQIIDISDIFTPVLIGSINIGGAGWNITVNGSYAYCADGNNGLQIIDVNNPSSPFEVAQYFYGDNVFDVEVVDTVAYLAHGTTGLRLLNVADPYNPQALGFYVDGNVKGVRVENGLAYLTVQDFGLRIVDVSDPFNIFLVAEYPSGSEPFDAISFYDYIYLADGDDGIHVLQPDFSTNIENRKYENSVQDFELLQNIPNPFSQITQIRYRVFVEGKMTLIIVDLFGNKTVFFENQSTIPGDYVVEIENDDLLNGIYFYQLSNRKQTMVKKMVKL